MNVERCVALTGLVLTVVAALGCAATSQERAAPVTAVAPLPEPAAAAESKMLDAPPPPPPAAPAPEAQSVTASASPGRSHSPSALEIAEEQLMASAGDCVTACRALGSMERATAHLCTLSSSTSDERSCLDARGKVLAGRDRVRASCGECPGGPSLDRNAPIPSTR
jgi:hypothetical protein